MTVLEDMTSMTRLVRATSTLDSFLVAFIRLFRKLSDERFVEGAFVGFQLWGFVWWKCDGSQRWSFLVVECHQISTECMTNEVLVLMKKKSYVSWSRKQTVNCIGLFGCCHFQILNSQMKAWKGKALFIICNTVSQLSTVLVYRLMHWRHLTLPRSASIMCVCMCIADVFRMQFSSSSLD